MEQHLRPVTRKLLYGYNKRIIQLAYQPLRLPTSFHLIARYRYALEYWTPLCSTSSNRKASSRPGSRRDSSALIPYLWINTELCTQPWRSRQKNCDGLTAHHDNYQESPQRTPGHHRRQTWKTDTDTATQTTHTDTTTPQCGRKNNVHDPTLGLH